MTAIKASLLTKSITDWGPGSYFY